MTVSKPNNDLPKRDRMSYAEHVAKSKMTEEQKQECYRKIKNVNSMSIYDK